MKKLIKTFIILCILGGLAYYCFGILGIRIYQIDGTSMYPTFKSGEFVISIKKDNYKRGDIVVYKFNNAHIIKRIIALPNEKIEVRTDGRVYINDKALVENYIETKTNKGEQNYPLTINNNEYFVIGDNRLDSYDSRYLNVGPISKGIIQGKIIFSINTFRMFSKETY